MQKILRSLSELAYSGDTFVARWRTARLMDFQRLVHPDPNARILDLGGTFHMWNLIEHAYQVTLVNLPGSYSEDDRRTCPSNFHLVEGDACDLGDCIGLSAPGPPASKNVDLNFYHEWYLKN